MVGDARSGDGGLAGRVDAPGDTQQRRFVEFRSLYLLEHSARRLAPGAARANVLGIAAAAGVRRSGIGARGAGHCHQAEVAICYRSTLELVAAVVRLGHGDVRSSAAENLEQHARGDESGAPPAIAAEGAHGRAVEPDQSALFVQHAEYRFVADSV